MQQQQQQQQQQLKFGESEVSQHPYATPTKPKHQILPLKFRFLYCWLMFLILGLGICILSLNTIRYLGGNDVFSTMQSNKLQPCDPTKFGLRLSNSTLVHNLSDIELFKCSSSMGMIEDYRFARMPKIAFMFLTRGRLPLSPLWERFFSGHDRFFSIYVHTQPEYVASYLNSSVFYHRQIPSQATRWGEMSLCDAERRLLATALLEPSNEHFILLSESCIPIHNFTTIYNYITNSKHSFIGSFDEPGPVGRGRYNHKMSPLIKLSQWRKGSQWFEVGRKLATDIIRDTKYYPTFKDFCKPACYIDEHYFQTMLSIQSPHLLANRSLTFVDWSRRGAHPETFGASDVSGKLFVRMRESVRCLYNDRESDVCYLFARKFAPDALERLLEVAADMFGY